MTRPIPKTTRRGFIRTGLAAGVALAESRGGTLRVTDPSPITAHLLRLVGMTDLLVDVADRSPTGVA